MKRAVIAALVVLTLAGCGLKEESTPVTNSSEARRTIRAEVIKVVQTSVPIRIEVTGQVTAVYQATLSSRIQSTIKKLLVREGMVVSKGQPVIYLDSRDLEAELARVSAELDNAIAHLDRMNQLYERDAVSKQEMENATRAYKVAEAGRKAIEAQLSYTIVKAPFDGVITEKLVEAGELASPGQPLLRMENPRLLRLEATVAERDIKSLSPGDKIPVVIDALGAQELTGTVAQILPAGDPQTHTFTVNVDLPATPGLKSGMFGRFQLERGTHQTILLPDTALAERGQLVSIFVVGPDGIAGLRWVKTGRRFDSQVEILSGVNVGESVLREAAIGADGALVNPPDHAVGSATS
ncbi:MAG: efflux RND transporter periplasmic adaptor subunit [Nitrospira sp.]|nr:efflux RND transporter periplasmic adaptor subunit [Nitrospira sp.]MCP9442692.1 efflux RND transporter periplasmic adaptor subunit [Nitrospira sp.]